MVSSSQRSAGANTPDAIDVVPLTLHIGAEIRGVDLAQTLSAEQLKDVRDAFLKWKVIFFRGQHLDHARHVAMARQFGEPTIGHAVFGHVEGFPEIYSVAKNRTANENRTAMMVTPWSGWHTDITAAVNPPCASILRGVTIPPYGGDTFWTNLVAAYNGLSPTMRGFVDGLRGIHKFVPREGAKPGSVYNERVKRRALESEHPLVTVHAETGERVLFISPSFPEDSRRTDAARKPDDPGDAMGACHAPGIHGAFQVERGRHRLLGQSLDLASGPDGHF